MHDRARETTAEQGCDLRSLSVTAPAGDAGCHAGSRGAAVQCRPVAGVNDLRAGHERVTGPARALMHENVPPHGPGAGTRATGVDADDDVPALAQGSPGGHYPRSAPLPASMVTSCR